MDSPTPLNPQLYAALVAAFGTVRIVCPGEQRVVRYVPDHERGGRMKGMTIAHGEQYQIDCPFCSDRRRRCFVKHDFGVRDPVTRSPNWHLFYCHNENCHRKQANWDRMARLVFPRGRAASSRIPAATNAVPTRIAPRECRLPPGLVSLLDLPRDHPAVRYLKRRGFNPAEISVRYGVSYCASNTAERPNFEHRLVVPVFALRLVAPSDRAGPAPEYVLAGWQARAIPESDSPLDSGRRPKYLSCEGFEKSKHLYGLPEAVAATGPVIVCEGVIDCWRVGPGAVALFGKSISASQVGLLNRFFPGRPVVVLLDRDARDEARDIQRRLLAARAALPGDNRAVTAELPQGCDDPGDCARGDMLRQIAEVLGISLEDLPATHGYDVVDGNERHLTALGRQRIGRTAVVYPAANTEAPDRCRDDEEHVVVVGEDRKVRYVPRGAPRLLRSLDDCRIVYYDALSGRRAQRRSGRDWSEPFDDLRVAAHLLDENGALDLPSVARRFLDGDRIGRRPSGATPEACRVDELAAEAQLIRDIWDLGRIPERLAAEGLDFVYREIELPVIDPTILMMERGVGVDVSLLERRHREYEAELERLGEKIKAMAGRPVDPGNADDVRRLLYDDLALPVTQRTADGGPSTGQAVLRALADAHLVIRPLLAFRKVDALRRSAGDLLRHVDRATGRVHCTLDPLGTATGRFTCMSPNLQGTPAALKDVLIPAGGCALVEADFSQIELRVLAHFSQDPGLLEAFETGGDLHRQTAAALYGISEHAVSGPKRQVGKVVNFSVIYGQTAISLAEELGTSPGQAQQFIDGFFARYPQVRPWIEQVQEEACACGLVRTLYGRRRRFPGLVPGPRADRRTLRQAVNSVIQGTAADILKLAIGRLHAELPAECRMLLTVHDSVLLEAPAGKAADAAQHVQQLMETPPPRFSVRLQAEVATKPC